MKIIDLLNKIANGEEVPKKIMFLGNTYRYDEINETYRNIIGNTNIGEMHNLEFYLNEEVEIIEENNKIERITNATVYDVPRLSNRELSGIALTNKEDIRIIKSKLSELIDRINEMNNEN